MGVDTRIQMEFHRVTVTDNVACCARIIILLPDPTIIILFVKNKKIFVWKDILLDQECTDGNTTHPRTYDNAEFVF